MTWCMTALLPGLLAGCSLPEWGSSLPEPRPWGAGLSTYRPNETPARTGRAEASAALQEPMGTLSLRQAMALALLRNPELRAFAWEIRAAEARLLQAGLWPNPELELEVEEFAGTGELAGTNAAEFTVGLAQTFPLGGDIARRREVAGFKARLAGWDYEAARIGVLAALTRRYVNVLARERRLAVAQQDMELAKALASTTEKRVEAGAAPQVEQVRARVPVARAQVRLREAKRELDVARRQLALMWDQDVPTFQNVAGELDTLRAPPAPEALAGLIEQNPQVARWAAEIGLRRAEADLARAEAVPDVTVAVGVKRLNEIDETAMLVGISLPLAIFDRSQGSISAARHGVTAAQQRRREVELLLARQLSEAWTQLANAYDQAVTLRKTALPAAEEAFDVTRRAFEQGDVDFLDALDAERTLVELRTQHVTALADYHVAAVEIESLIGQGLADLTASTNHTQPHTETEP